ncbi:MAG: P-II family nitrogen regulator [Burkholderiales bacterium]
MEIKLILAMVRRDRLETIEQKLKEVGAERVDVSTVKGYGEYRNFFSSDWMGEEVRIEVFTRQHKAALVVQAIVDGAHTGTPGDGVVAVLPVDELHLVRTRAEVTPEEFWPKPAT